MLKLVEPKSAGPYINYMTGADGKCASAEDSSYAREEVSVSVDDQHFQTKQTHFHDNVKGCHINSQKAACAPGKVPSAVRDAVLDGFRALYSSIRSERLAEIFEGLSTPQVCSPSCHEFKPFSCRGL